MPGTLVRCIAYPSEELILCGQRFPVKGRIYTVRGAFNCHLTDRPMLHLEEIKNPEIIPGLGWSEIGFFTEAFEIIKAHTPPGGAHGPDTSELFSDRLFNQLKNNNA